MKFRSTHQGQAASTKCLAFAASAWIAVIAIFGLSGCSTVSSNANNPVPPALVDAGEYGENIYDLAKANDWPAASEKLDALKKTTHQLRGRVKNSGQWAKLGGAIKRLEEAVAMKDRQATMREANQVTFIVAGMTTPFQRANPVEITLLDYYGRELELGAAANDEAELKQTAIDMQQAWNAVLPSIIAHGGKREARNFGELVARVEAAKSPADYGRLATPVLDEVDNLEKLYTP